jgi:hypothetical protein
MLREQFGDLGHWDEQPPASFDEKSESVALIELRCFVVLGVDHESVGRDVVPQHAAIHPKRARLGLIESSLLIIVLSFAPPSIRGAPPKRIGGYGQGETEVKDYRD